MLVSSLTRRPDRSEGVHAQRDKSYPHHGINNESTGFGFGGVTVKNGVIVNFWTGVYGGARADNVTVSKVVVSGNSDGIFVGGDFAKIESVTAAGNTYEGVTVYGDMASIKSLNTSGNTTGLVIGLGIFVEGFTVPPVGTKNNARGNDDPAECTPTYVC